MTCTCASASITLQIDAYTHGLLPGIAFGAVQATCWAPVATCYKIEPPIVTVADGIFPTKTNAFMVFDASFAQQERIACAVEDAATPEACGGRMDWRSENVMAGQSIGTGREVTWVAHNDLRSPFGASSMSDAALTFVAAATANMSLSLASSRATRFGSRCARIF